MTDHAKKERENTLGQCPQRGGTGMFEGQKHPQKRENSTTELLEMNKGQIL